ncbi:MAG: hypothetical protein IJC15_03780 [Clostridia bacterium]|nr:hypothetical protein [Clostridia bacterium]
MKKYFLFLLAAVLLLGALLLSLPSCRYVCRIGDLADAAEASEAEPLAISDRALDRLLSRAAKQAMPSGKAPLTYEIVSQAPISVDGRDAWGIFLRVRDAEGFVTVIGVTVASRW